MRGLRQRDDHPGHHLVDQFTDLTRQDGAELFSGLARLGDMRNLLLGAHAIGQHQHGIASSNVKSTGRRKKSLRIV